MAGRLLRRYWFLIGLLSVLLLGIFAPGLCRPWTEFPGARDGMVAAVLFATTLPHNFVSFRRTLARPGPPLVAVVINSVFLPLMAYPVSLLLPPELGLGVIVAASVPSTLASAAVWTRRAGGNDLIPVLVTVITNLSCFLVSPFWVWLLGAGRIVALQPADLMWKLAVLVVTPMIVAQVVRQSTRAARLVDRQRHHLGTFAQLGILFMVAAGAVKCGDSLVSNQEVGWGGWDVAWMAALVVLLHLAALTTAQWWGRLLGYPREDWIAVGFAGSQKTLMVGLHLALAVGGGPAILPMLAYHILQLVVDTTIADRLRRRLRREA